MASSSSTTSHVLRTQSVTTQHEALLFDRIQQFYRSLAQVRLDDLIPKCGYVKDHSCAFLRNGCLRTQGERNENNDLVCAAVVGVRFSSSREVMRESQCTKL